MSDLLEMAETGENRTNSALYQDARDYVVWQAHWSERIDTEPVREWMQKRQTPKNVKLQKRGKTLNYSRETEEVKKELSATRVAEWNKWQKHGASQEISSEQPKHLRGEGAEEIGTQWIETDKN